MFLDLTCCKICIYCMSAFLRYSSELTALWGMYFEPWSGLLWHITFWLTTARLGRPSRMNRGPGPLWGGWCSRWSFWRPCWAQEEILYYLCKKDQYIYHKEGVRDLFGRVYSKVLGSQVTCECWFKHLKKIMPIISYIYFLFMGEF